MVSQVMSFTRYLCRETVCQMIPVQEGISKVEAFDLNGHILVMTRGHVIIISQKDALKPRWHDNVQLRQVLNRLKNAPKIIFLKVNLPSKR